MKPPSRASSGKSAASGQQLVFNSPPYYDTDVLRRDVDEDAVPGQLIGEPLLATDPDGDKTYYSMYGSNTAKVIMHYGSTLRGQLQVVEASTLDYDGRQT